MKSVLLSIIIVTYKSYPLLKNCLKSIIENNDLKEQLEIIVVDNAPDREKLSELKVEFSNVLFVESSNNGFGAGNNLGAQKANGKYLFFLNPDTVIPKPFFSHVINRLENKPQIGMAGCKLVKDGRQVISFNFRKKFGIIKHLAYFICFRLNLFLPKAMYTSGADLFVKASVFRDIGGFDPQIFMYSEELDLIYRVNSIGYKGVYFRDIEVIHLEGGSSKEIGSSRFQKSLEAYGYVLRKYSVDYVAECKKEIRFLKLKRMLVRNRAFVDECIMALQSEIEREGNNEL